MAEMNAVAVIGSGYGDEGKGHMVDYYARTMNDPIVVRFNGGAQAGHTVVSPDGNRHIFSHFGSGTFANVPTYLSKHFVVNPFLFKQEHEQFVDKFGITPTIYLDPNAFVTTPYEMLVNQTLESMRKDIHGSVGVGFGETLERVKRTQLILNARYMTGLNIETLKNDLWEVRERYVLKRLDITNVEIEFLEILDSEKLQSDYYDALRYLADNVMLVDHSAIWDHNLIFEGAQGLLLDQDYGHFPHVTRSNTGLRNVMNIMEELPTNFKHFTANYVTRAYATRHGAGPLANEQVKPVWVQDNTNVRNEWQGPLRYAPLDFDMFESITTKDFALYGNEHNEYYESTKVNTITCVDQLPSSVEIFSNNQHLHFDREIFVDQMMPQSFDFVSSGPTYEDVVNID